MKIQKWLGLLLILMIGALWYFFFNKSYSEKGISDRADHIICIDTKKITATAVWHWITTPAAWKTISFSKKKTAGIDWKRLIKIPDYIFIFHIREQPASAWYTVVEIKDAETFAQALSQSDFRNVSGTARFVSPSLGLEMIQQGKNLLVSNAAVGDTTLLTGVAADLFQNGRHIKREKLAANIAAKAHISWQFTGGGSIPAAKGVIRIEKNRLVSDLELVVDHQSIISQNTFPVTDSALMSLAMIRPPAPLYQLIPSRLKTDLSRLANFNIDSLFQPGIESWQAQINAFTQKSDTAISYDYDDAFNPIEKKIIHTITEPDFSWVLYGSRVSALYRYWQDSTQLQNTPQGLLFTPLPFVKMYASMQGERELKVETPDFKSIGTRQKTEPCILYAAINLGRAPDSLIRYVPQKLQPIISKLASMHITATSNRPGRITIQAVLNRKAGPLWLP